MAKLVSIALGNSAVAHQRSSLDIVQESFQLAKTDSQNPVFGFTFTGTDDGRGTGSQFIPLDDAEAFCDMLEGYADPDSLNGVEASANPVEVARNTMELVQEKEGTPANAPARVAFRTARGQGMKPTRIVQSEIPAVVAYLRSRIASSRAVVAGILAKKG
jgi:hypothetical protein